MIAKVLAYFAKRSHDIKTQAALASLYGCVSLFGIGGTIVIVYKLRKKSPVKITRVHHAN